MDGLIEKVHKLIQSACEAKTPEEAWNFSNAALLYAKAVDNIREAEQILINISKKPVT